MATRLSILVSGLPSQALLQVQTRLDGIFGARRIELELIHDGAGILTEIQVIFPDDVPDEDIRAFRRSLLNIDGRGGTAITVPRGSGGVATGGQKSDFDADTADAAPPGFTVVGGVTVASPTASGPTTLATIGGVAATHDLSTTPITADLPIEPGSVSIAVDVDGAGAETITDDGVGGLSGTGASLGAGTISYATGTMSGTTGSLTALSDIDESHSSDTGLSPLQSAKLDSGAAAGDASIATLISDSAGAEVNTLEWSFSVNFLGAFGLNNNGVAGAQPLTLEARLLDAVEGGGDIVLQWATLSDDASAPTTWGVPTFAGNALPSETPTGGITIPIGGTWHLVRIRKIAATVLGVTVDTAPEELFTFARTLVVPTKVALNHNWGDDLDRFFNVDDWNVSFALPLPVLL